MRTAIAPALVAMLLVAFPDPEALPSPAPAAPPPVIELLGATRSGLSLRFELPELETGSVSVEGQAFDLV